MGRLLQSYRPNAAILLYCPTALLSKTTMKGGSIIEWAGCCILTDYTQLIETHSSINVFL